MLKKRLFSVFSVLCFCITLFNSYTPKYNIRAEEPFTISVIVTPDTIILGKEATFTAEVRLDNVPEGGYDKTLDLDVVSGLCNLQCALYFDKKVVSFDADKDNKPDYTEGSLSMTGAYQREADYGMHDTAGSSLNVNLVTGNDGELGYYGDYLEILWGTGLLNDDSNFYLHGSGVLFTLKGTVLAQAPTGSSELGIYEKWYYDAINNIDATIIDFSSYTDIYNEKGEYSSYVIKQYTPNFVQGYIDVLPAGATTTTSTSTTTTTTLTTTTLPVTTIYGDIDQDNQTTISDLITLIKLCKKSPTTITLEELLSADINQDNTLNAFDILLLKRFLIFS